MPYPKYKIQLTELGKLCVDEINITNKKRKNILIEDYIIMPDHIHMIVEIQNNLDRARPVPTKYKNTLLSIVGAIKSDVSKEYNKNRNNKQKLWQRSYYEHIIRNEKEYFRIYEYMEYNPIRWLENKKKLY